MSDAISAPSLISGTKTTEQPRASKGPGVQVRVELEPIFLLLLIVKFLSGTPRGLPLFLLLKSTPIFSPTVYPEFFSLGDAVTYFIGPGLDLNVP